MRNELKKLLAGAAARIAGDIGPVAEDMGSIQVEHTRDPAHGDFSSNMAMVLAKKTRRKPRDLAEAIIGALPASSLVERVEIAGPGFINFFVRPAALQNVVSQILAAGNTYGRHQSGRRGRILVEFVSANPTGPMHVGHGRGAAYGDSLCNLLAATGWEVHREFYINDAGRQVDVLAVSVWARYLEACGAAWFSFPKRGYPADYVRTTAERLRKEYGDDMFRVDSTQITLLKDPDTPEGAGDDVKAAIKKQQEHYLDALIQVLKSKLGADYVEIRQAALQDQLAEIKQTLEDFGIGFDAWVSEQELVSSGGVSRAIERLEKTGYAYARDGALWFDATRHGDEKERVLRKSDGSATYFCNDLAYHVDKLDRGFPLLLDIWGADHHGYIARMRAAMEALTGRGDALQVQLVQFVTLSSGRMGKRSGKFVTLKDLIAETGRDASRFFYLLRSHEQHLEFDIDLARAQTTDNPVYYIQYAHARICSVFRQLREKGLAWNKERGNDCLHLLTATEELKLISTLARYSEVIESAALAREPHQLAHYLQELANHFHIYYNAHKILTASEDQRDARLNLIMATAHVLANGLELLGVSAPQSM